MNTVNLDDRRLTRLIASIIDHVNECVVCYMPSCKYRDMFLWAFSTNNPQREEWLRALGLHQMAYLGVVLFDALIPDEQGWDLFIYHFGFLAAYFTFETVSDDLALGLAHFKETDTTYNLRLEALHSFNHAMMQHLDSNAPIAAVAKLAPIRETLDQISGFAQKLCPEKHRLIANLYIQNHPDVSLHQLDASIWPALVTNIEQAHILIKSAASTAMAPLVFDGLWERYRGVNRLLRGDELPVEKSLHIGIHTILVIPALAYCIMLWAEKLQMQPEIGCVVANGMLRNALYSASLLSRICNDLGRLVMLNEDQRTAMVRSLRHYMCTQSDTFADVLMRAAVEYRPMMTRLEKDIYHGEFNICLSGIRQMTDLNRAHSIFELRLQYFSEVYRYYSEQLVCQLDMLSEQLQDQGVGEIIWRFVGFHEGLYSNPYNESGDYTI